MNLKRSHKRCWQQYVETGLCEEEEEEEEEVGDIERKTLFIGVLH